MAVAAAAVVIATAAGLAAWQLAGRGATRHAVTLPTTAKSVPRTSPTPPVVRHAVPQAVPILMYHVIARPLATAPYPGLYVPPAEFAAQMAALHAAGYHAVTLDEVWRSWGDGTALPRRPVVLTFDNGYRTQFTRALPILRRYGWVADENLQLSGLPPRQGGLSHREVRDLLAGGWELDTQGYSHADLVALDPADLRYQVLDARRAIRRLYGVRADWFCYPSGYYDAAVIAAVRRAGFLGSTTVVDGWAQRGEDPYRLPRLRVLGGTTPGELLALIAGTRHDPPPPESYPQA